MRRLNPEQPQLFPGLTSSEPASSPPNHDLPRGFLYRSCLLTEAEQSELLDTIRHLQFRAFDFHGFQAKRRVIEFGFHYDFEEREASAADPIPAFLLPARSKAAEFAGVAAEELMEGIITEYSPGAPIGWHRDVHRFEVVIGISLASSCRMRFKPVKGGKITSIVLEPGSAYVLRGPARWQYQHSIPPVKDLRYSITFRTLRTWHPPEQRNNTRL
jgi:alkylated DNA repair dioxygenase AlkB